jgi:DNA-binding response OmpR family regulator
LARVHVVVDQPAMAGLVPTLILVANRSDLPRRYQLPLQRGGCCLVWARTVEAAAALSEGGDPDLLILDLEPPVQGLRKLSQIRAHPTLRTVPLIVLGAYRDMEDIRQGLALGACDYLIRDETSPSLLARRARSWLAGAAKPTLHLLSPRPAMADGPPSAPAWL